MVIIDLSCSKFGEGIPPEIQHKLQTMFGGKKTKRRRKKRSKSTNKRKNKRK